MRHLVATLLLTSLLGAPAALADTPAGAMELNYQSRVALAHDWATAFKTLGQTFVEVRVWQPEKIRSQSSPGTRPPELVIYYENVTRISDVGGLVLLEYKLASGKAARAVVPAERIVGIFQGE